MDIESLQAQIDSQIQEVRGLPQLEEFKIKYLGRKGAIAELTGSIPGLPPQQRADLGRKINALKNKLLSLVAEKESSFASQSSGSPQVSSDLGMPGIAQDLGRLHPLTQVTDEVLAIFSSMGFCVVEGPEVETEFNNFTGLNIPLDHPSRDAFDTFYLNVPNPEPRTPNPETRRGKFLLRSHTSPVQIRVMKARKPPLAVVVPGRVYRPDAVDASHAFMFHQVEGFLVDTGIKFSDLKGILEVFAKGIFGENIKMRFRPHFFPFTEPSAEVDVSCIICKGVQSTEYRVQKKPCSVCGGKGWLEILGSGMIHPNVFKHVGIDPKIYSGFAFGMGIERIAMLKYGISDIRLFFENDLRFLKQF